MYNIFSFKGKIDQSLFIIYYIILMIVFFTLGFLLVPKVINNKFSFYFVNLVLFVVNLLVFLNYKKRLFDIIGKLWLSIILALFLSFDHLVLPFVFLIFGKFAMEVFFLTFIIIFCVQPAIVGFLPAQNK